MNNRYLVGLIALSGVLIVVLLLLRSYLSGDAGTFLWICSAVALLGFCELPVVLVGGGRSLTARQSVNRFLSLKVVKVLASLLFVLLYLLTSGAGAKPFLPAFAAIYLVYLAFDTIYLMNREKQEKNKKTDETMV